MTEARINIKTDGITKNTLEKAASLTGQNLSSFLLQNALSSARAIIKDCNLLKVSDEAMNRILLLLDNPPKANKKLKNLLRDY